MPGCTCIQRTVLSWLRPFIIPFLIGETQLYLRSTMLPFRRAVDRPPGTFALCLILLQKPCTNQSLLPKKFLKKISPYFFLKKILLACFHLTYLPSRSRDRRLSPTCSRFRFSFPFTISVLSFSCVVYIIVP
jgi:hypothetical protein